ncbi:MAG: hypothetical protein ACI8UO_003563 [Verrucomicrobiales bacterium]
MESELPAELMKPTAAPPHESVAVYLAPVAGRDLAYRFTVGPDVASKSDAASGFVTDAMDPRHSKFDPDWSGEWTYESRLEPDKGRWLALLKIPFKTLGVEAPESGGFWRVNFGRIHVAATDRIERSLWSVPAGAKGMEDQNDFGELVFADPAVAGSAALPEKHLLHVWREEYNSQTFEIPAEWKNLSDLLPTPLDQWLFHTDPLEQGIQKGWHQNELNESDWVKMTVLSFWAENATVGEFIGYGWYRTSFTVPADWQDKGLRLLFASVDEQAWIYVNGELVREHSVESEKKSINALWETPITADVPATVLKYGEPNVLAVRVHNSVANGGIWRPVQVIGTSS